MSKFADAKKLAPSWGIHGGDEEDWETEYLDLILAVKVVSGVEEAIAHIAKYGSGHSEAAIVTRSIARAVRSARKWMPQRCS